MSTEPAPVWMPHPRGPSSRRSAVGSTTTVFCSVAIANVANEDCPNQREATALPSTSVAGGEPSNLEPMKFFIANWSQYGLRWSAQLRQCPHESNDNTTWSPGAMDVTPAPTRFDDAGALVARNDRQQHRGRASQDRVGVADPGADDSDEHLIVGDLGEFDRLDRVGLVGGAENGCSGLHRSPFGGRP